MPSATTGNGKTLATLAIHSVSLEILPLKFNPRALPSSHCCSSLASSSSRNLSAVIVPRRRRAVSVFQVKRLVTNHFLTTGQFCARKTAVVHWARTASMHRWKTCSPQRLIVRTPPHPTSLISNWHTFVAPAVVNIGVSLFSFVTVHPGRHCRPEGRTHWTPCLSG